MLLISLFSIRAFAAQVDVEDPHICSTTDKNFPALFSSPKSSNEALVNAIKLHCSDKYQESAGIMAPLLQNPVGLEVKTVSYAYILQSINLNNTDHPDACSIAKLSMVHANESASDLLRIRSELNYFSFCDVYADNTPYALERLYELSAEASALENDYIALTIYNQLSYVYYMLDQNQLSAEALEQALLISEAMKADDYFVTLYNMIDAYLESGELNIANQHIAKFEQRLTDKNSVWETFLLSYAKMHHAFQAGDYEQVMALSERTNTLFPQDSSSFQQKLASLQGIACLRLNKIECAKRHYEETLANIDIPSMSRPVTLEFIAMWLVNEKAWEKASEVQNRYIAVVNERYQKQQQAAKVLGVAKLNNEVIRLNAEKARKQLTYQHEINRLYLIGILVLAGISIVFAIAYLRVKAKQQPRVYRKSR
ncbi:hypothetical protein ACFSJY_16570 [Thalassotalea euphylliae]|uniref:hypothetical protein n=1 Tax=Thalassotalea euphylliae TaxID=1655234 RepID=UPI003636A8C8